MPLDEDDWKELTPTISDREMVLEFFEENPSKSYSIDDVMGEFSSLTEDDGLAYTIVSMHYRSVLDDLSMQGKVDERQLESEFEDGEPQFISYYRFRQSEGGSGN